MSSKLKIMLTILFLLILAERIVRYTGLALHVNFQTMELTNTSVSVEVVNATLLHMFFNDELTTLKRLTISYE